MLSYCLVLAIILSFVKPLDSYDVTDLAPRAEPTITTGADNQCCFVIQDHLSVNYWAHYFTSTWYGLRKVTTVISTVTQYQDTAITNYETKTTIKNATYATTIEVAEDWVYASNAAPGPTLHETKINATQTSIADRVVTSPTGFFVYPSVKIINVPAITDANGNLACTTASTYHLICPELIDSATSSGVNSHDEGATFSGSDGEGATFSGVNSHVQAYYTSISSAVETSTNTHTVSRGSKLPGPMLSQIPITNQSTFTMTGTATVTNITHATSFSTTELSFATPFLYFPSRGTTEVQNTGDLPQLVGQSTPGASLDARAWSTTTSYTSTEYDPLLADYGYVPQDVIDSLAQIPEYIKQYPSLASCLPGGPSILPIKDHEAWINIMNNGCNAAAPGVLESVPDLTTSLGTTVQAEGCFHPGACVATVTSAPAPASTTIVALPAITTPLVSVPKQTIVSSPKQEESGAISSKGFPDPMSILAPIVGSVDQSSSKAFNPAETATAETAKPATKSEAEWVTAGADTESLTLSFSLPVIVMASPTDILPSAGSGNVITTAGHTLTFTPSASAVVIGGQTINLGSSAVLISGTSVSLGSSGLVIGTSTVPLSKSDRTMTATGSTQGLGGIIAGAFGPHQTSTEWASSESSPAVASGNATSPLAFQGVTPKKERGLVKIFGLLGVMAGLQYL